jgi:hypothetical protein
MSGPFERVMAAPIRFAIHNLVAGPSGWWALYRIETASYDGLTVAQKHELLASLSMLAYVLEADFQLLRVTRAWSPDDYCDRALGLAHPRHGHHERFGALLDAHREALGARAIVRPEVYLCVRLPAPEPPRGDLGRRMRAAAGLGEPAAISDHALSELGDAEARAFHRLRDCMATERATTLDIQWLVRRAFCRGRGEPVLDAHYRPQALVMLDGDQLSYRPLEADVLRLFDSPIHAEARGLRVDGECGDSHQATLVLGALPETVEFPGSRSELLSAPLEALDFPVDATVHCRWVANQQARALVRRRVVDADNIYSEESDSDHGPSSDGARRPGAARALEDYITGEAAPPLLHATISLTVGAPDATALEDRVERLGREYGTVRLHRPYGEQLRLFAATLPGQPAPFHDYADYLLVEQFAAMMAIATTAVGSETGAYIGHTLSGSRQPVLLDLSEASRTSRAVAMLLAGTLGSGKTLCLELLLYQAYLMGSRIVDIDPKGDHRLHELPGVAEHCETIELGSNSTYRGLLDPLRIAPAGTAEDLAYSFLCDVLPAPVPPTWRTAIRSAIKAVVREARPGHCGAIVDALRAAGGEAVAVAAALAVHVDSGLAQLGFADDTTRWEIAGAKQITTLRIRNLPRPLAGTPRSELTEEERVGQAVLRLVAAYAMHLMGSDRSRHKVLGFDEAWFLLQDSAGRRLIEHLNRWGRSEGATPILVTHLISDVEELDNLIGTRLVFGMESDAEARAALSLLRLDPDDEPLRQRLLAYRQGRCLIRDLDSRVAAVQIDVCDPQLLAALDTTPTLA